MKLFVYILLHLLQEQGAKEINITVTGYKYISVPEYEIYQDKATEILLDVKGCSDAHIGLSDADKVAEKMYEIVIGGWSNSQSVIRLSKQGLNEDVYQESGILDCSSFRRFNISWRAGDIRVSKFSNGTWKDIMKFHHADSYNVTMLCLSSWGSYTHDWIIYQPEDTCICFVSYGWTQSNEDTQAKLAAIKTNLTLSKKNTSKWKRTLYSAQDDRLSAQAYGLVGCSVLLLVLLLVIAVDLRTFFAFVHQKRCQ